MCEKYGISMGHKTFSIMSAQQLETLSDDLIWNRSKHRCHMLLNDGTSVKCVHFNLLLKRVNKKVSTGARSEECGGQCYLLSQFIQDVAIFRCSQTRPVKPLRRTPKLFQGAIIYLISCITMLVVSLHRIYSNTCENKI